MTTPPQPRRTRVGDRGTGGDHRRAGHRGTGGTRAAPRGTAPRDSVPAEVPAECDTPEPVRLQLQWFVQSQFAGYYAALDQGYYEDMCIDLEILEGGVEIVPQTQLANGDADFAIAWVPKALASREAGANIANIAQIFQRSGTLQVSFKDAGITTPDDFAGKTIGNWGFGNEYEIFAALGQAGLDPASDVTLVAQNFDMVGLLDGSIDAAEAMTYNEYAQVLEAENPDTGELYTPEDFNVISYEDVGVGMLQDAIWADAGRLASDPAYMDSPTRFVAASIQGWAYCRDNVRDVHGHRARRRPDARRQPPAVADERDQQADLAGPERHRLHRPGGVGPHRRDRSEHAQPRRRDGADRAADRRRLHERHRRGGVGAARRLGLDLMGADYTPTEVTLNPGGN